MFLLFTSNLSGYHADEYPIGAYTHYQRIDNSIQYIADKLENANFNVVLDGFVSDDELVIFNEHSIDVIHSDNPQTESILKRATRSNYWEYEAEYYNPGAQSYDPPSIFPARYSGSDSWPNEMWYYEVQRDFPQEEVFSPQNQSNILHSKYFISCEQGLGEGFAVDSFNYHSQDSNLNPQICAPTFYLGLNTYLIKYTMAISNIYEYSSPTTEVCKIGLKLYDVENEEYIFVPLEGGTEDMITLTRQDFEDVGAYNLNFVTFEYTVSKTVIDNYENPNNKARINLCPVVWYSNNGSLNIDNVIVSDNIYQLLDDPNSYVSGRIIDRVEDYYNSTLFPNIFGFAATDEPATPQFYANWKVKDRVESVGDHGAKMLCCVCLRGWYQADYHGYPHHNINRSYSNIVNPSQLMPDVYPSTTGIKWDLTNTTSKWGNFQGRVDLMTEVYVSTKNECKEKGSDFFPIVQCFGKKVELDGEFIWDGSLIPPNESQKLLSYLPLCYGADGVFYYVFENSGTPDDPYTSTNLDIDISIHDQDETDDNNRTDGQYYQYSLVNNLYGTGWIETPQYQEVIEANEKIISYGKVIKNFTWEEDKTATLMPEITSFNLSNPYYSFVNIIARDTTGISQHPNYNEGYQGFVECSVYEDGISSYFMLVNRRGNFPLDQFVDEYGKLNGSLPNFPEFDTNDAFVIAEGQTVSFTFNDNNFALVDIYNNSIFLVDSEPNTIDVSIDAGEGILLKLIRIAPSLIQSNVYLSEVYIPHDVTIQNGACLIISHGCYITDDINITVQEGGSLIFLDSECKIGNFSSINVYGDLSVIDSDLTSLYENRWGGITCHNSTINIENSTISNAVSGIAINEGSVTIDGSEISNCSTALEVIDSSSLDIVSSIINIPENGAGIWNPNIGFESDISISGTEELPTVFHGLTAQSGTGINSYSFIEETDKNLACTYTNFDNLFNGVSIMHDVKTDYEFENCYFTNCNIGISLFGLGTSQVLKVGVNSNLIIYSFH